MANWQGEKKKDMEWGYSQRQKPKQTKNRHFSMGELNKEPSHSYVKQTKKPQNSGKTLLFWKMTLGRCSSLVLILRQIDFVAYRAEQNHNEIMWIMYTKKQIFEIILTCKVLIGPHDLYKDERKTCQYLSSSSWFYWLIKWLPSHHTGVYKSISQAIKL